MSITSYDPGYFAAARQKVPITRTGAKTSVASGWFSIIDMPGQPGAGNLVLANTPNGALSVAGANSGPSLNAFTGGATGYLGTVEYGSNIACRLALVDRIYNLGSIGFAAGTNTVTAFPSISGRVPTVNAAADYRGLEIWIEVAVAFATGTAWQVQVNYTNESGTAGRSTIILPATAAAGLTQGRMYQLALQAGDSGVQSIQSVVVTNGGTLMTAGSFNVLILRPLWSGRVQVLNGGDTHGPDRTGMPIVFATSYLELMVCTDSTTTGTPDVLIDILNG
jgi:hypothetical protein